MAGSLTIQLNNVRFIAAHGLYAEETQLGNEFEIDVKITFKAPQKELITIEKTVDYVSVYQLIKEVMQVPQGLLENCAIQITDKIQQQFDFIKKTSITIRKINAPITSFTGSVGVTYTRRIK